VSTFIQIARFLEVLVPDPIWTGLLTPVFFSLISLAESLGLLLPRGTTYTVEVSVLLAYLGSVALSHPGSRTARQPSEPAASRKYASGLSRRTVRDAAE
jgi:hypothetical protein